ncbi:DEAD/DEAH box helicase [Flavobacterium sp. AG291]|uniref:DEAD/DEAH box helicase n=1 Tax=Flavobacterium sp. AG291 TaxID=2184000 RepID=UPI000E0AD813|nr:DEAD/DEAH box helicase [Flavobacterium sp. AG291]RDI14431.1 replicative superfamily II helicase [Flavobacterium sp. AG291]
MNQPLNLLKTLYRFELLANAQKLNLVAPSNSLILSETILIEAISILNELSIRPNELQKKQLVAISALLWTYRDPSWDGLKNYLVLFLSRAGFAPSSIMVDDNYQESQYSGSPSLINQFAITYEQATCEITVASKTFLVSEFQKQIWQSIDQHNVAGISAPTSAGKSFIILLKAIHLLHRREGIIIYVVPTLSLVSQVMMDFRNALNMFNIEYSLESTYNSAGTTTKSIYVLTQEKAIAAFAQTENPFGDVRMVVIDEIQNVEKVADSDDQRSKVLYDLIIELSNSSAIDHVVISGPKIVKIDELGTALFGVEAKKNETDASPVLNLTYSISKIGKDFYLNVYSDLLENVENVKIEYPEKIQGYGKVLYNDPFLGYVKTLMESFKNDECSLIFSPTSDQCSKIAESISDVNTGSDIFLEELGDFIAGSVHPTFPLSQTIKKGVAYHHGKLPFHARVLVEDAIRQKKIKTIISTTTLLQGVNLPVQNIIIRNPNLFIRKKDESVKLSNYEIANLRGRAGRLLKDFVGRTFILDEESFKNDKKEKLDLSKNSGKEIKVGYGDRYIQHANQIASDIENNVGNTIDNQEYSYLTTYLRQAVLRHGTNTQLFLSRVGIYLSDKEFERILLSVNKLKVKREVCSRNRYWDPVDLSNLSETAQLYQLPTSASEANISYKLNTILQKLKEDFPVYYNRYFGINNTNGFQHILRMSILAESWLKEKPLVDLFSDPYYDDASKIEKTISDIQNKISYGLPLLLKPLYDIKQPENMFIRFIELGAFLPITRKLIELNIPRETAIHISKNFAFTDIDNKYSVLKQLRDIKPQLLYWHQVQLNSI